MAPVPVTHPPESRAYNQTHESESYVPVQSPNNIINTVLKHSVLKSISRGTLNHLCQIHP
uniref:Uncharacterized protein n=1 Tax=Anguilla anguilla TaxID=7936 RepID=A0A0E9T3Y5_ANGAN